MTSALTHRLKSLAGPHWTTRARCLLRGLGLPRWGNLRRTRPFSDRFGFDRGTPIDRYYLDAFFRAQRPRITGDVLEIQMPQYTERYGHDVRHAHSVDISPRFRPTFLCDLALADAVVPSDAYDCFLLPNSLCNLRDVEGCLRQALRVIKPGGVILATAAGFVPLTPDDPDYWHLSAAGWEEVAARVWPGCDIEVESHGNCLAGVAAMLGLAWEELSRAELDVTDARYPVLVTLTCRKPAGA
jgi:hypothetical protein